MLQCFNAESNKDFTLQAVFDPKQRSYTYPAEHEEQTNLHYITNSIPKEIVEIFETYPERLENSRKQAQVKEDWARKKEEKLAAEKPEYDRIRSIIINDPQSVISQEFYSQEDTPATRALKSTLKDSTVNFPEEVLITLLKELPPGKTRDQIFSRPELSEESISKLCEKYLTWGHSSAAEHIANNPNTPRWVIEEIATNKELLDGTRYVAQQKMNQYAKTVLDGDIESSQETF